MDGKELPSLKTEIPGPSSRAWVTRLANTECPAITARRARRTDETGVPQDPIVWESAVGANVRDVDENVYVDLTGAFAVSGPGHRHPRVVEAAHSQLDRLIHAMGDVYPSDIKIEFCERLAELAPGKSGAIDSGNVGSRRHHGRTENSEDEDRKTRCYLVLGRLPRPLLRCAFRDRLSL